MKLSSVERRSEILRILSAKESVDVESLAEHFQVSRVTIRTDLDELAEKGMLVRTHGGAIVAERKNFIRFISKTVKENSSEKDRIAKTAVGLIKDGDTIILDSGSTTLNIPKYLASSTLTVVTDSLVAAHELADYEGVDLLVLGGLLRRSSMNMIGPMTKTCLEAINAKWLLMGATAVSIEQGISTTNLVEAEVKQMMIRAADKVCLLADSTKLGKTSFGKVCDWDQIDYFITDKISEEDKIILNQRGVTVLIAK